MKLHHNHTQPTQDFCFNTFVPKKEMDELISWWNLLVFEKYIEIITQTTIYSKKRQTLRGTIQERVRDNVTYLPFF